MSTPLSLHTGRHRDGRPIVSARGEIDITNLAQFVAVLEAALSDDGQVIVDLTEVEYLDSGAINAMFRHAERLHLIANPVLIPALEISGLTTLSTLEPS